MQAIDLAEIFTVTISDAYDSFLRARLSMSAGIVTAASSMPIL
jgi:hypothetical protein